MSQKDYASAQAKELESWPGVVAHVEVRSKHQALVLTFGGASRFVMFPTSGSEYRGVRNHIIWIWRELAAMGAVRVSWPRRTVREPSDVIERPFPAPRLDDPPTRLARDSWAALRGLFPPSA